MLFTLLKLASLLIMICIFRGDWDYTFQFSFFSFRLFLGDTSDPMFVKQALLSGRADKVLVESILAAEYLQKFNHLHIVLEEIKKSELAYGLALNGEAKRLTTCLRRYFKEHENQILLLLSKLMASAKVCPNSVKPLSS